MINYLYRIILIFSIVVAMLFLPQTAQAQPLSTYSGTNISHTNQLSADDLFKRGVYEALIGNYKVAIEDFNQVIQIRPNDAIAYANKGLARAAIGEQQEAIADFNSAVHINPDLEVAYYNRGYIRFELQDYQGALADFNQAIAIDPQNADAYHCRCLVRHQLGDMQGVVEDLQTVEDLYLKLGKLEEYQGLLNNIKKLLSPNDSSIL